MSLPPQNWPRVYPPAIIEEVCRLARETFMSQREIGIATGLHKSAVHTILGRNGIKTKHWHSRQHMRETHAKDAEPRGITLPRVRCLEGIDD